MHTLTQHRAVVGRCKSIYVMVMVGPPDGDPEGEEIVIDPLDYPDSEG